MSEKSYWGRKTPKKKVPTKVPTKKAAPKPLEIYIIREYPNKRWLKGSDSDGMAVRVEAPRYNAHKLVGQKVPVVAAVDDAGETYYKYAP